MPRGLLVLLVSLLVGSALGAPTAVFTSESIHITDAAPLATLAWFSVTRENVDFTVRLTPREGFAQADAHGAAVINIPGGVGEYSVWAFVDLSTGSHLITGPSGFPIKRLEAESDILWQPGNSPVAFIEMTRPAVDLFVARPKVGAWSLYAGDGGLSDGDSQHNDRVRIQAHTMRAFGGNTGPPERFLRGDIIIMIDPATLEVLAHTIN